MEKSDEKNDPKDTPNEKDIGDIIAGMYDVADSDDEGVDYISHGELMDIVRGLMDMDSQYIMELMLSNGFKTKNIEGTIYWMVKEK